MPSFHYNLKQLSSMALQMQLCYNPMFNLCSASRNGQPAQAEYRKQMTRSMSDMQRRGVTW